MLVQTFVYIESIEKFTIVENSDCPSILHKINWHLWKGIVEHTPDHK